MALSAASSRSRAMKLPGPKMLGGASRFECLECLLVSEAAVVSSLILLKSCCRGNWNQIGELAPNAAVDANAALTRY